MPLLRDGSHEDKVRIREGGDRSRSEEWHGGLNMLDDRDGLGLLYGDLDVDFESKFLEAGS